MGVAPFLTELEPWIKVGLGDAEYMCEEKGATFPAKQCPDVCPDLTGHSNYLGEVLRNNPELYDMLKDRKTSNGVTLAKCIKTGMDNKFHPNIKTVGMVGGDEESFEVFKELFDPVISARHGGYPADATQPNDLNVDALPDIDLDPYNKYVMTSRVRSGRSIRGFCLPPSISFEKRRELEKTITTALLKLEGDLHGDYFPLVGSKSYEAKPNGMSLEKQEELLENGNLFQEPDSTLLLCGGMGRHWPDSRGIFHNDDKNLFVWLNEEDHMRIVSMAKGKDIRSVVSRFFRACNEVQRVLQDEGREFMRSEHLGWILTCPSNLGTGLRAGCWVRLPLLSQRPDFKEMIFNMGLQARGQRGVDALSSGGIYDISNKDRLGKSEVELVTIMMNGIRELVEMEHELEMKQGGN